MLLAVKGLLDFEAAPFNRWENLQRMEELCDQLRSLPPSQKIRVLSPDIVDIQNELGLFGRSLDQTIDGMKEALRTQKLNPAPTRRWFAITHQLGSLTKIWSTIRCLMCMEKYYDAQTWTLGDDFAKQTIKKWDSPKRPMTVGLDPMAYDRFFVFVFTVLASLVCSVIAPSPHALFCVRTNNIAGKVV